VRTKPRRFRSGGDQARAGSATGVRWRRSRRPRVTATHGRELAQRASKPPGARTSARRASGRRPSSWACGVPESPAPDGKIAAGWGPARAALVTAGGTPPASGQSVATRCLRGAWHVRRPPGDC
jgi:hypothetical protein